MFLRHLVYLHMWVYLYVHKDQSESHFKYKKNVNNDSLKKCRSVTDDS